VIFTAFAIEPERVLEGAVGEHEPVAGVVGRDQLAFPVERAQQRFACDVVCPQILNRFHEYRCRRVPQSWRASKRAASVSRAVFASRKKSATDEAVARSVPMIPIA
jgi:hypothetical protein